ncbi:MAG: hypothetical protein V1681_00050 [Candidatus Neomarinimicrobiota bacterium]
MKYKISYRVLITIVFSFTVLFMLRAEAQGTQKNRSSFTWDLGFGSGSFKGFVPYEYESVFVNRPGTDRFTDLATAFRLLIATGLLNSRLSIGAEWDFQKIRSGDESEYVEYVGGDPVIGPDKAIHSVLIIGDYLITKMSDNVCINIGGGLGMLFFTNINTRMEYDQNTMMPTESDESTIQPAATGRLLVPIRVHSSFTIDPEIRLMASTGQEKVFLAQFLVGLTYNL